MFEAKGSSGIVGDLDELDTPEPAHAQRGNHADIAQLNVSEPIVNPKKEVDEFNLIKMFKKKKFFEILSSGERVDAIDDGISGADLIQAADELVERLPVNDQTADALWVVCYDVGRPDVLPFLDTQQIMIINIF